LREDAKIPPHRVGREFFCTAQDSLPTPQKQRARHDIITGLNPADGMAENVSCQSVRSFVLFFGAFS
jgi:hypothetical protein